VSDLFVPNSTYNILSSISKISYNNFRLMSELMLPVAVIVEIFHGVELIALIITNTI
jgi:hypothetical protein